MAYGPCPAVLYYTFLGNTLDSIIHPLNMKKTLNPFQLKGGFTHDWICYGKPTNLNLVPCQSTPKSEHTLIFTFKLRLELTPWSPVPPSNFLLKSCFLLKKNKKTIVLEKMWDFFLGEQCTHIYNKNMNKLEFLKTVIGACF